MDTFGMNTLGFKTALGQDFFLTLTGQGQGQGGREPHAVKTDQTGGAGRGGAVADFRSAARGGAEVRILLCLSQSSIASRVYRFTWIGFSEPESSRLRLILIDGGKYGS